MTDETNGVRPDGPGAPAEGEARPATAAGAAAPETAKAEAAAPPADLSRRVDELTRAYAELVNDREAFKRRLERERERLLEAQKGELAKVLLDTLDEIALAIRGGSSDAQRLADGLRLIAENAAKRVESLGLSRIPAEGHVFDPSLHEAVDLLPTPDPELDGRVIQEVRAGWKLGERVIRAARVRVGRHVPAAATADAGAPRPDGPSGE
jgi:molecular chaperone GrpE